MSHSIPPASVCETNASEAIIPKAVMAKPGTTQKHTQLNWIHFIYVEEGLHFLLNRTASYH